MKQACNGGLEVYEASINASKCMPLPGKPAVDAYDKGEMIKVIMICSVCQIREVIFCDISMAFSRFATLISLLQCRS